MKDLKSINIKIIFLGIFIIILLLTCIFFNINRVNKNAKTIVYTAVYIDDQDKIGITLNRIFRLDSTGKCVGLEIIMNRPEKELLDSIVDNDALLNEEFGTTNLRVDNYTLYYESNKYNGVTEAEIKNNVYNEFKESESKNTKYNVYISMSEF